MANYTLRILTKSDAVFGSGSGINSQADIEIQHDSYGLPFLGGKALKGLLDDECANILFSLYKQGKLGKWPEIVACLFGVPGSGLQEGGCARFGNAELPPLIRQAVVNEVKNGRIRPDEVLKSLTSIRYQTSINYATGAAEDKSLRSKQVLLREIPLEAQISLVGETPEIPQILSAAVKAFRRAGLGRNRGSGELKASLHDSSGQDVTQNYFQQFLDKLQEG